MAEKPFIPSTLAGAVAHVLATLNEDVKEIIRETKSEDSFIGENHFFGGMNMRNAWGLWKPEAPLHQHFKKLGLYHADDMSGLIFRCVYRELKRQKWEVDELIKKSQEYWKRHGIGIDGERL